MTRRRPQRGSRVAAERRRVRGDLDAIIARALHRDPAARYATATEFAADIRAYLGNFPVQARQASRAYVAHKFAQRHWGGVLSALLTLLVLVGATVVTALQTFEARRQRDLPVHSWRAPRRSTTSTAMYCSTPRRDRHSRSAQLLARACTSSSGRRPTRPIAWRC